MLYYPAGGEFDPAMHAVFITFAKRALLSAYSFLEDGWNDRILRYLVERMQGRPLIMDSGVFTLQRRTFTYGEYFSHDRIIDYCKRYIELLKRVQYSGAVIEVDCHGIVKPETGNWKTQTLPECRKMLEDAFGDKLLYAYHPLSGLNDCRRLIDDGRRVATSAVRVKEILSKKKLTPVQAICATLRNNCSKPEYYRNRHFHILGTTTPETMKLPNNFSCDSATWSMVVRYGRSLPNTPYMVTWWRRQGSPQAPDFIMREVHERKDELFRNYWQSPAARPDKPDPNFTMALAYALVASQTMFEVAERKLPASGTEIAEVRQGKVYKAALRKEKDHGIRRREESGGEVEGLDRGVGGGKGTRRKEGSASPSREGKGRPNGDRIADEEKGVGGIPDEPGRGSPHKGVRVPRPH